MDIPLKANVHCTDGLAGQAICVIVEERDFPHLKRLVPVALITSADSGEIHLGCTTRQLATLRPFLEIEYPRDGALFFTYEADEFRSWPYETPTKMPVPAELERVSPGELPIHQESPAPASDGEIGRVKAFQVNPSNQGLISIIIETGYFWNRQELIISIAQVDHFEEDLILLKLRHHLNRLAAVQTQESYV